MITAEQFVDHLRSLPPGAQMSEEILLYARIVFLQMSAIVVNAQLTDGHPVLDVVDCQMFIYECARAAAKASVTDAATKVK